jgi:hypothetical protein
MVVAVLWSRFGLKLKFREAYLWHVNIHQD